MAEVLGGQAEDRIVAQREPIGRMIRDLVRSRDVLDQVITEARDTVGARS
ncbi:hypothetical protein [Nonomuraea dietziae]